jgi:hypothetical protein
MLLVYLETMAKTMSLGTPEVCTAAEFV